MSSNLGMTQPQTHSTGRLRVLHISVACQVAADDLWIASITSLQGVANGHHPGRESRSAFGLVCSIPKSGREMRQPFRHILTKQREASIFAVS